MESTMTTSPEKKVCEKCHGNLLLFNEDSGTYKDCQCRNRTIREKYLGNLASVDLMKIVPLGEQQKKALDSMRKIPFKSWLFTGTIRAGKTFLMAGLHNHIQDHVSKQVQWFSDYDLKKHFVAVEMHDSSAEDIIMSVRTGKVKMLFIDDLGKATVSDCYLQGLFHLVDELMKRETKICITSIISLEEMAKVYGISITRRIEDLMDTVVNLDERKSK